MSATESSTPGHARPPAPAASVSRQAGSLSSRVDARLESRLVGLLGRIRHGRIQLVDSSGRRRHFGDPSGDKRATVFIRHPRALRRVFRHGEIGLGESYVDGDWDSRELARLIEIVHLNDALFGAAELDGGLLSRAAHRLLRGWRTNSLGGSRRNASRHYDLGNDLYAAMLDSTMSYSCALFRAPGDSLETAQRNKIEAILKKARIARDHHVLEIGSGWGGLAVEAARTIGCRVTGITLSREQLEWSRALAAKTGVDDRVTFELCDYRELTRRYDRVVSVEMIEAVGHRFLGAFFEACDRALAPGGLVVLQTITMPDQSYDAYRRGRDWLRKHIFPGGLAPSLTALCEAMRDRSRFVVDSIESIGAHYAPTLREWRRRFDAGWPRLEGRGYDERFRRMWSYYLSYCEGGFAARRFDDLQIVLRRAGEEPGGPCERARA